ncbi:O-antigen ligase family protein [Hyphomicrobium sp.]|uniref:O-antigen ligase family protein n=1 Tax=Hyphomicrobium sp. TaxID=82 RepID=UPI002E365999|nr:O-antigen ligase family protein [Hyphomicrobium sp.]HEX2841487.1 O-antigen ligase family protein [Hyphomicrobium sp.]
MTALLTSRQAYQNELGGARWIVSASLLAAIAVAAAMGTSSIVFSEPAVADILMAAVIVGVPLLGVTRFGHMSLFNLVAWLIFVSFGLAGCSMSTNFGTALTHQVVTLFLALGAFVLAGYVTADPEPRFRLIMTFYVVGCLIATAAAFVGYFQIIPSTYDLFTNYGRARGTFKDPNVLGAALAPAIVYVAWVTLRSPPRKALIAAAVALPLCLALLLTFSRGAWASAAFSLLIAGWLALVTTRRAEDFRRLVVVAALGTVALVATLGAALETDAIGDLFEQRASLDQSYDEGPDGRFGGQAKAVRYILDNPFGVGTHTFRDSLHPEEAHNVYLSQFLNAGWIGGTFYLISVFGTLAAGVYAIRARTALQGPLIVATASFAGLVFEGFVIDTDHWRHFFVLMALIWGLVDATRPEPDPRRRAYD